MFIGLFKYYILIKIYFMIFNNNESNICSKNMLTNVCSQYIIQIEQQFGQD